MIGYIKIAAPTTLTSDNADIWPRAGVVMSLAIWTVLLWGLCEHWLRCSRVYIQLLILVSYDVCDWNLKHIVPWSCFMRLKSRRFKDREYRICECSNVFGLVNIIFTCWCFNQGSKLWIIGDPPFELSSGQEIDLAWRIDKEKHYMLELSDFAVHHL